MNIYSRSKGQIMPVSLFGTALLAIAMLAVFNTSQLSNKKQRLNNAADAAAYSAALFQSRGLNSIAYTNRAMIANQVFIAQMVSTENYLNFWQVKSRNLSAIPYINLVAGPINQGVTVMQNAFSGFTAAAVQGSLWTNRALSAHQRLVVDTGGLQIERTVNRVLDENDRDIKLSPLGAVWLADSAVNWRDNFGYKDKNEDLIAKGRMINDSRDGFTRWRNYKTRLLEAPTNTFYLEKIGTTELTWETSGGSVNFRWDALDILSVRRDRRFRSDRNAGTIGWSRRSVSGDGRRYECNALNCDGGRVHRTARNLARTVENEAIAATGFSLQPYHELSDDLETDPRFPVSVGVVYDTDDIRTSDRVSGIGSNTPQAQGDDVLASGLFHVEPESLGNTLEAVARAEVFFRRNGKRRRGQFGSGDNLDEFSNVWNPYWSARLVDSDSERDTARAAKGFL